ncbi:MAG: MFS transporter, partial [Campylobacter upsaliensis]
MRSILVLSFIVASRFFGLFIVLPVLSLYALKLENANDFLVGLLVGVYALMQVIFQVPFGMLSDKIGRKKTMLLGLVLFIIGSLICSLANDIYTMLLGRILQGSGAIGAVASAMISDFVSEEQRGKAMAMMGGFIGIAFALSMVLAPIMSAKFGLSSLFDLSA